MQSMEPITITYAILSVFVLIAFFLVWRFDRDPKEKQQKKGK